MNVRIFEMPMSFGASRDGSEMGPDAIRLAGLESKITSLGHAVTNFSSPMQLDPAEYATPGTDALRYMKPIVKACTQLAASVEESARANDFSVILGGDHSIVLGSLAGIHAAHPDKKIGVLYVDAHGDFNTLATSPSGNIHGMCMSGSCGYGEDAITNLYNKGQKIDPKNVCYIGCRDLDTGEKVLMKEAGVSVYTMADVTRLGIAAVMKEVIKFFKDKVDLVHISFDIDVLDPQFAPGVGIRVPYGMTPREGRVIMEEMGNTNMVCSCDMVEVNPVFDKENLTAQAAADLIACLLGDRLY